MSTQVYLLTDPKSEYIVDYIRERIPINGVFLSESLSENILIKMAKNSIVDYFYVITTTEELSFDFDFSFVPDDWDKKYVHTWNNDRTVRLFHKGTVLSNPNNYTDQAYFDGKVEIKNMDSILYSSLNYDIIFLSYDESNAEENFNTLKLKFPYVKRIQNIKGIFNAHREAARISDTLMFYVVDADAKIVPEFLFNHKPSIYEQETVHVWHSHNPVNDLEYGYGGVKLFPRAPVLDYKGSPLDFTTSVSKHLKVIETVSNVTHFNTDPFSAWRAGFRECTKLARQSDPISISRLDAWCTKGSDREFGDFVIEGANEGREFGIINKDKSEHLGLINDFNWLEERFSN